MPFKPSYFVIALIIIKFSGLHAQSFELRPVIPEGYLESTDAPSSDGWGYNFNDLLNDVNLWKSFPNVCVDTIGYSVQGRPLIRLVIARKQNPKTPIGRIAIHARTHPAEVHSTYVTNEMIKFLLTPSTLSDILLDNCIFNIVPMYNPDGVELGYARTNANLLDIEGNWSIASTQPEITALRSNYKSLMESPVPIRIALNMHSAIACKRYFVYHHSNGTSAVFAEQEKKFIGYIKDRWPEGIEDWNYNITWSAGTPPQYPESWFWNNYGASVMALTYEDMNCASAGLFDKTAWAILNGISDYLGLTTPPTGIGNLIKETPFSLYPNPAWAGSTIHIKSKNLSEIKQIEIFSSTGKSVYTLPTQYSGEVADFTLPTLSPGIYVVVLSNNSEITRTKIMVQ